MWEPISFIILQLFVLRTTECVQRQFAKKKISSILFVLWPHLFVLWSHCGGYGELLSLHLVHCIYCGQSGQSSRCWPKKGISHVSESISAQSQYTTHCRVYTCVYIAMAIAYIAQSQYTIRTVHAHVFTSCDGHSVLVWQEISSITARMPGPPLMELFASCKCTSAQIHKYTNT